MAKKKSHPGRRGLSVSIHPLSADDAIRAILNISKEDVKRIRESEKDRPKKK